MKLHRNIALGVVEGLQNIFTNKIPLRVELQRLLKLNRKWGSRDRRLLGEVLLDCIRWKTTYAFLGNFDDKTKHFNWKLLGVWLLLKEYELPKWEELIDLKKLQNTLPLEPKKTTRVIRHSIPDWLDKVGMDAFGEVIWEKELSKQNEGGPLVLRVNTLKTTPEKLQKLLEKKFGILSNLNESYPEALILEKHSKLTHLEPYQKGLFEIQDANSQLVSHWVNPKPGMKIIDACAGAGYWTNNWVLMDSGLWMETERTFCEWQDHDEVFVVHLFPSEVHMHFKLLPPGIEYKDSYGHDGYFVRGSYTPYLYESL